MPFCSYITSPKLTHWGRDNNAAILHTTLSSAFTLIKKYEFWLTFHRNMFSSFKHCMVPIMAWRRPGDKPSPGPMMVGLLTHICFTQPQCGTKPLSKQMLVYFHFHPYEQTSVKFEWKYKTFRSRKFISKYRVRIVEHFVGEGWVNVQHQ